MIFLSNLDINKLGIGGSFVHKLHPLTKFIMLVLNYIILLNISFSYSIVYIIMLVAIMLLIGVNFKKILLIFVLSLIPLFTFGILIILIDINNVIYTLGLLYLRIIGMIIPMVFFSSTTTIREVYYLIYMLIHPFKYLKLNTNLLILTFSITFSFFPILLNELDNILLVKASKGENFKRSSILKKIKIIYSSLAILLINSIQRANILIDSILIRGFDNNGMRSFYIHYSFLKIDYFFSIISIIFCIFLIFFNV